MKAQVASPRLRRCPKCGHLGPVSRLLLGRRTLLAGRAAWEAVCPWLWASLLRQPQQPATILAQLLIPGPPNHGQEAVNTQNRPSPWGRSPAEPAPPRALDPHLPRSLAPPRAAPARLFRRPGGIWTLNFRQTGMRFHSRSGCGYAGGKGDADVIWKWRLQFHLARGFFF